MADDDQEKQHDASQTKLDKAAEKGQIVKSSEISSAAVVLSGGFALLAFAPFMGQQFRHVALACWGGDLSTLSAGGALDLMGFAALSGIKALAPVLGIVVLSSQNTSVMSLDTKGDDTRAESLGHPKIKKT